MIYLKQKNYALSKSALNAYLAQDPNEIDYINFIKLHIRIAEDSDAVLASERPAEWVFSNPFLFRKARLEVAKLYLSKKKYSFANDLLKTLLSYGKDPVLYPQVLEASLKMSLDQKKYQVALEKYAQLLKMNPLFDADQTIKKRLEFQLKSSLKLSQIFQNQDDFIDYLRNLYKIRHYFSLETASQEFMKKYPNSSYLGEVNVMLGVSYFNQYRYRTAQLAFQSPGIKYLSSDLQETALYYLGQSSLCLGNSQQAFAYQVEFLKRFKNSVYEPSVLYGVCSYLRSSGSEKQYQRFRSLLESRYPGSSEFRQLNWEEDWKNATQSSIKSPSEMTRYFQSILVNNALGSRFLQFYASQFKKQTFSEAILSGSKQFPLSYYSYQILQSSFSEDSVEFEKPVLQKKYQNLYRMGLGDLAIEEMRYAQFKDKKTQELQDNVQLLQQEFLLSSKKDDAFEMLSMLQQRLPYQWIQSGRIPKFLVRFFYPKTYWGTVLKYANKYQVDPYLVLAIIREESRFNPTARSKRNARGLMQLMPKTAKEVSYKLGLRWQSEASLYSPELNIQLGAYYLSWLQTQYNHPYFVVAAYNAGPEPASRWIKRGGNSSFSSFTSTVEYPETRQYLKRVFNSYLIYKVLYPL